VRSVQKCAKVFWWQDLAFVTASCAVYSRSTGHAQMLHDAALCTPSSRDADELLGCSPCMSVLAAQSLILPAASWHSATGMQNDALRCTKYQTSTLRQTWDFALAICPNTAHNITQQYNTTNLYHQKPNQGWFRFQYSTQIIHATTMTSVTDMS
jgi:hypothetical protein